MTGSQTTIALTGSPAAGQTVTLEMNGYPPVTYTLNGEDTLATTYAALAALMNDALPASQPYQQPYQCYANSGGMVIEALSPGWVPIVTPTTTGGLTATTTVAGS
jgi:hypothetical protein